MISESTIDNMERLDGAKWSLMLAISIFLHLLILSIAIFFSGLFTSKENDNVVYEVDLVDLPVTGAQAQAPAPAAPKSEVPPVQLNVPVKKIAPVEEKKIAIPVEKTPLNKKTLPVKKEVNPTEVINTAIAKLEKKVKAEGGEHLNQAITDLEKKNKSEENHLGNALSRLQNKAGGAGTKSGASGTGPLEGLALQIYRGQITAQIYGNWSYPTAMPNKKGLEAIVTLKVREDGTILQSSFKKRSNDAIFDQSVTKAIEKSNPLLPLPEGYGRSYEEIEVTFNLEKLLGN
jgi:colicin import membrane protein